MEVIEGMGFTGNCFGLGWDHLGSFRFLCVRYLYVDPVYGGRAVVLGQGEIPLEFGGDWLPGLGERLSTPSDLVGFVIRIGRAFNPD
jgi:hypothetical protein